MSILPPQQNIELMKLSQASVLTFFVGLGIKIGIQSMVCQLIGLVRGPWPGHRVDTRLIHLTVNPNNFPLIRPTS